MFDILENIVGAEKYFLEENMVLKFGILFEALLTIRTKDLSIS